MSIYGSALMCLPYMAPPSASTPKGTSTMTSTNMTLTANSSSATPLHLSPFGYHGGIDPSCMGGVNGPVSGINMVSGFINGLTESMNAAAGTYFPAIMPNGLMTAASQSQSTSQPGPSSTFYSPFAPPSMSTPTSGARGDGSSGSGVLPPMPLSYRPPCPPPIHHPVGPYQGYDPATWSAQAYAYATNGCYGLGLDGSRRKNATRESTATLKAWLQEHLKNPYPTKGEKIMLAIITKMTLTQVSTWFANARRRLKKENKMTWSSVPNSSNNNTNSSNTEHKHNNDKTGKEAKSTAHKTSTEHHSNQNSSNNNSNNNNNNSSSTNVNNHNRLHSNNHAGVTSPNEEDDDDDDDDDSDNFHLHDNKTEDRIDPDELDCVYGQRLWPPGGLNFNMATDLVGPQLLHDNGGGGGGGGNIINGGGNGPLCYPTGPLTSMFHAAPSHHHSLANPFFPHGMMTGHAPPPPPFGLAAPPPHPLSQPPAQVSSQPPTQSSQASSVMMDNGYALNHLFRPFKFDPSSAVCDPVMTMNMNGPTAQSSLTGNSIS